MPERRRVVRQSPSALNAEALKASILDTLIAFREWHTQESGLTMVTEPKNPPAMVFILRREQEVLDVYGSDLAAFEAAAKFRAESNVQWKESRPGRWWSVAGALAVDPWTVKGGPWGS